MRICICLSSVGWRLYSSMYEVIQRIAKPRRVASFWVAVKELGIGPYKGYIGAILYDGFS